MTALEILLVPGVPLGNIAGSGIAEESFLPAMALPDKGYGKAYRVGSCLGVPVDIAVNEFGAFSHSIWIGQFVRFGQVEKTLGATDAVVFFFD